MRPLSPPRRQFARSPTLAPDDSGGGTGSSRPPDASDDSLDGDENRTRGGSEPRATRRTTLRAVGGALGVGGAGLSHGPLGRRDDVANQSDTGDDTDHREDFLWLGSSMWTDDRLRENMLAFARRHDLAALFSPPASNGPGLGEMVRPALENAREFEVDAWFNLGVLREATPEAFRNDAEVRERHLAGLREVAGAFDDLFAGGRVVLWQEAPVMGNWTDSGEWNAEAVDNWQTHGPAIFDAQQSALRDANSSLSVGIFPHFPYVVDSKRPGVFPGIVEDLRERDAMPDFACTDFYRGWYEKDVGPGPADDAVRSLITNAREALDGRDVFYLAQAHTINPGHTPSRQAMRANLRASLDAGAAGLGWYPSGTYTPTESGFDPFVPNDPDAELVDERVSTVTVARDRYLAAWMATLDARADITAGNRFDLWIHGEGFDLFDHRVETRTADGEWALVGDVDGYADGEYPYAGGRTTAFRALERDRLLGDGALELRVDVDPSAVETVAVLPWDPDAFVTEHDATELLEGDGDDVASVELGRASPGAEDSTNSGLRVTVPVDSGPASLASLVHPDHTDAVDRLAAEYGAETDPGDRFDLWLAGASLDGDGAVPSLQGSGGDGVRPAEAAVAAVSTSDVALYYGLSRERFLDGGLSLGEDGDAGTRVDAAYAMPAATAATFRSPGYAAGLLDAQQGEVATFAVEWTDDV